jgi:vacuolar-type H+-ATPase catalytic subunit A/Vma1
MQLPAHNCVNRQCRASRGGRILDMRLTIALLAACVLIGAQARAWAAEAQSDVRKAARQMGSDAKQMGKQVGKTARKVGKDVGKASSRAARTIKKEFKEDFLDKKDDDKPVRNSAQRAGRQ